jgi:phosphoribosylformylglycinamidine (FGAM) synthase-like enzyme
VTLSQVGMVAVVKKSTVSRFQEHIAANGYDAYVIGEIVDGDGRVEFTNRLIWQNQTNLRMSRDSVTKEECE